MKDIWLLFLCLPVLLAQQQYETEQVNVEGEQYPDYGVTYDSNYPYHESDYADSTLPSVQYQNQLRNQEQIILAPTEGWHTGTEPTEPGPLDCREEQYPCTRLYSVHKPCKNCLSNSPSNHLCFYSLRRVYVINKEVCVRTVCAHEELLRADLCRDKYSKCGVMASSGLCGSVSSSCIKSCGIC